MQVQDLEKQENTSQMRYSMKECIENCLNCFKECEQVLADHLRSGKSQPKHFVILKSCADICEVSAKLMMVNSHYHSEFCALCSKVCFECAEECSQMDDKNLKDCIEACYRCAESCKEMGQI